MTTLLTEEQTLLRDSARSVVENEYPVNWVRQWTEAEPGARRDLDRALWRNFAELGWLGLLWPEEVGGLGLGCVEQALVLEELGRGVVPSAYLSTLICCSLVDRLGGPQRSQILSAVCAGERSLSFALIDEADGVACSGGETAEVILDGEKNFVPDALAVDQLLVAAREKDGRSSWFLVEATASGLDIRERATMDATRPLHRVSLRGAPALRLGAAGDFARIWSEVEPLYWMALCAEAVGGSERVLRDAVAYAKDRVQFGAPIGANQAIKHKCANMLIRVEGSRAITYHAARRLAAGSADAAIACAMAKAYTSEAYREVSSEGIQIHGGVGFTWEFDCHFFYKRARAIEMTAGHPDEHRERVAAGVGL